MIAKRKPIKTIDTTISSTEMAIQRRDFIDDLHAAQRSLQEMAQNAGRELKYKIQEMAQTLKFMENDLAQIREQYRKVEILLATNPEAMWHSQQFTIQLLQKEFRDRVPPLEKESENMRHLSARMDRLETRLESIEALLKDRA